MQLPLIEEFLQDLEYVRGRSLNTVKAYQRDLLFYESFLKKGKDTLEFYNFMKKNKLSPRSQSRVISSLRTYARFREERGNPCPELSNLKLVRHPKKLPEPVSLKDFQKILESSKGKTPYLTSRNELVLILLFGLGCRVSELISITLYDFNETGGVLNLKGKGDKERFVPLTEFLKTKIKDYVEQVRPHLCSEDLPFLIVNDKKNRASRVDIWRWLKSWSLKAGFKKPISPHKFRHGCATTLLDSQVDLRSIQTLLGHSSISTTQIYTDVSSQNIKKVIETHHPFSHMHVEEKD